ncbi:VOC family protein [Cellulosimicrobium cellulans]|uniref:VOC family protein n=1 Tax=Cellulosimicrobium cellulans TaxID=1710 RepID=UPI0024055CA9|nr:VOC family protein [Cellulosimicrobium cellulans]MDF9875477.1 putative enzyme related to lactoylglutathione lyase [Cellulosimicrobium cellulans]
MTTTGRVRRTAGSPRWLTLATTDPEAAAAYYASLFGWRFEVTSGPTGVTATCPVEHVRIGPVDVDESEGWTTHFEVTDLAAAVQIIRDAGGYVGPVRSGHSAEFVHALDPNGAALALRDPGRGVLGSSPGRHRALAWSDLHTRSYEPALQFYSRLFHYTFLAVDSPRTPYSMFHALDGGELIGGIQLNTALPESVPAYWLPWLNAADADRAVGRAVHLGSTVLTPVTDGIFGRMGIVKSPWGEVFGVVDERVHRPAVPSSPGAVALGRAGTSAPTPGVSPATASDPTFPW